MNAREMIAAGLVLKKDVWGFSMSDQARAYFERLKAESIDIGAREGDGVVTSRDPLLIKERGQ
jgi:hypothetical protein